MSVATGRLLGNIFWMTTTIIGTGLLCVITSVRDRHVNFQ